MMTDTLGHVLHASDADARAERAGPSFERVYDEHVDFVWRSARRLGVDDAAVDDVVQHVFLVVHRRFGEFEGRSSMKTWLFAILLRAVSDHRRTLRRKSPHLAPGRGAALDDLVAEGGPHEALERREASETIDRLLDALDEEKRAVFVMAELEEMTAQEIAAVTGLAPAAVYTKLRAARIDFERAATRLRKRTEVTR